MFIPEKAIIEARSEAEARQLLEFLIQNGYHFSSYENSGSTCWSEYADDDDGTCYDLEIDHVSGKKQICYCNKEWYEENREDGEEEGWWPTDPMFEFIGVEHFLAICNGVLENDSEIEIESVEDIL